MARSLSPVVSFVAVGLITVVAGCHAKVATVEITPKEVTLKSEGDVKTLVATAKDKDGMAIELGEKKPAWTSGDNAIAVVDTDGKVKPAGSGKTIVTAKIDEASGSAKVSVQLMKGIKLESPAMAVKVGVPHPPLKVAFTNEKGEMIDVKDAKLDWKTADPNIATVAPDGTVSGVAAGSTTVSAHVDALGADVAVTVLPADAAPDAGPAGAEAPEKDKKSEEKKPEKKPAPKK